MSSLKHQNSRAKISDAMGEQVLPILGNEWWPLEAIACWQGLLVAWVWPVLMWLQCVIVWLTVLVTLERWVAICRPFDAPRLLTKRRSRLALLVLLATAALYSTPRFLEFRAIYQTEAITVPATTLAISTAESQEIISSAPDSGGDWSEEHIYNINQSSGGWWTFEKSLLGLNEVYSYGYSLVLYFVLVFLCPVVLLTKFNVLLLLELRRLRQRWEQLTPHERRQYKVSM